MSTDKLYDVDIWPLAKGEELQSAHFEQLRRHIWLLEHYCAGNLNTTELYGKWTGDAAGFAYVEWDRNNWKGWNPGLPPYHYGFPVVKYRWGSGEGEVDIFVFNAVTRGDVIDLNPPVLGGQLNSAYWLLSVDPNKYAHWNYNAGRPDIGADARWIISHHGYDPPPDGEGWLYGRWPAWMELPTHTDPFEQVPHVKQSNIDSARHHPVEPGKEQITKSIRPALQRTYQDGYVGEIPNHTLWVHSDQREKVSEYVHVSGDPAGSIQVGPSYVDAKMSQALQDRALHLIESNYNYLIEVDQDWKESWQYWNTFGVELDVDHDDGCVNKHYGYAGQYRGAFTWPKTYQKGDVVYYDYYWWRCIQLCGAVSGDYAPDGIYGDDYWKKPLHQPDYIKTDPIYVQFSDYLWHCNSSAFEKVLKQIGHYDWYWDENAAVPWFLYQNHYLLMTEHRADPDAGWAKKALERWPIPRGCWRRVWRHTMSWDHDRDEGQKARLGKTVEIDGKKVSMMWPGELGGPPGYDRQLFSVGEIGGYHYDYQQFAHAITQEQYDAMERPGGEETKYTRYYTVVDVEAMFKAAYGSNSSVESRIAGRHDPTVTEWLEDVSGTLRECPVFEMKADLVNDIREALLQLKLLRQTTTVSRTDYHAWDSRQTQYSTSLAAYTAGKSWCDAKSDVDAGGGCYGSVGYVGFVAYNAGAPPFYRTVGSVTLDYQMELAWTQVTITRDAGVCFPATSVGTLIFDVLAMFSTGAEDSCSIGAGSFVFTPPIDDKWHRAYIGQIPVTCEYVHDGAGDEASDWTLVCTFQITPAEPWPPDAMFNFDGAARGTGKDYYKQTSVDVATGSNVALAWELDFDGFDESVFKQDRTNCIEV